MHNLIPYDMSTYDMGSYYIDSYDMIFLYGVQSDRAELILDLYVTIY